MPFVPVANTVEVELRFLLDGQHIENTLYFEIGIAPDPSNMTTLLNNVESWWIDNVAPLCSASLSLVELVATDLTTATGPQVTVAPVGGDPGGLGQPALPNNVTLSVSFRTANRGRSFRGRNYFPVLSEGQVTDNTVTAGVVTAIQDAYAAILTDVNGGLPPVTWVVVSRFSGIDSNGDPIPRVAGISTPVTTVVIVDPIIDSQRRRLPGRGR